MTAGRTALALALLLTVLAEPARAAELGDSTTLPTGAAPGGNTYFQPGNPAGANYTVPAGGGVITGWAGQLGTGSSAATFRFKIARDAGGGQLKVVGSVPGTVPGSSSGRFAFPAKIPVQAGDVLGIFVPAGGPVVGGLSDGVLVDVAGEPADGVPFTAGSPASAHIGISATLEPDADGDQFGDESQDACPADPLRHEGPCVTDLEASLAFSPASPALGGFSFLTAGVRALAGIEAQNASVALTLPAGVKVLSGGSATGDCATAGLTVTCPLGNIPAGELRRAFLLVRPTRRGPLTFIARAASSTPDSNSANDIATATMKVGRSSLCKVPRLKGATPGAAKKKLKRAGCRLGPVRGSRSKSAHVTGQTIPAGTRVQAGTKVGVRVGAR